MTRSRRRRTAYFKYINAHGGINGRTITYKYLDDGYDPAKTVTDVHQLVEQDNVFAIFNGLGTPTHQAVVPFLNQQKVPDLFVASGCLCWNNPAELPGDLRLAARLHPGRQDPRPVRRAELQGQEDRDLRAERRLRHQRHQRPQGRDPGELDRQSTQRYDPTNTKITPQVEALQKAGAQVVISFSVPAFTALLQLTSLQLKFAPQLVVSNVGSDPMTLSGLLTTLLQGRGTRQAR